jgi:hypothetical protein
MAPGAADVHAPAKRRRTESAMTKPMIPRSKLVLLVRSGIELEAAFKNLLSMLVGRRDGISICHSV